MENKDRETLTDVHTELNILINHLKELLERTEKLERKVKDRILGWDELKEEVM